MWVPCVENIISICTGLFSLWPHWTQLVSCNVVHARILLTGRAHCLFWGLGTGLAAALRPSNEQQSLRSTGGGGQRSPTSPATSLLQQEKTRVGPRTATEPRGEDFLGRANCAPSFLQSNGWGNVLVLQSPAPQGQGGCWLKVQGDETIRETAGTGGPCPDPPKFLRRSFSVTWVTAYSFYSLSQDLNPPHDILRFSQNKTSSDLQLCHFKGSEWAWEMLYFMGSSEHHRSREESVTEARWDWNY